MVAQVLRVEIMFPYLTKPIPMHKVIAAELEEEVRHLHEAERKRDRMQCEVNFHQARVEVLQEKLSAESRRTAGSAA